MDSAIRDRIALADTGLTLPSSWSALASVGGVSLAMDLGFDGDRIALRSVHVAASEGITPFDLARLRIAEQVHAAGVRALGPSDRATDLLTKPRAGRRPCPDEARAVASVYWIEHATWGQPKKRIQEIWGLPKSTASRWIRAAASRHPMPGPHTGS